MDFERIQVIDGETPLDAEFFGALQDGIEEGITKSDFHPNEYTMPTIYFEGDISSMDKDNDVTLNYTYGEREGTCTLKWQGSSSIMYPKKNYTVKFDNAFEAAEGWGAEKKYCLKADWIDFSHCRNVGTAKLWGEIVKSRVSSDLTTRLSALVNGGAIDGFPCFVVINGEWQGIYNFNIPKDGYMFGMGSGTKEAILCADQGDNSDFGGEVVVGSDFELEYNSDTFTESEIQESFNRLVNAVRNSNGYDIDTTVAQYLDIDSAIDYYILVAILKGTDMISKNAIFATYDGVKWFMSAYDLDCTWGLQWDGRQFLEAESNPYERCSFYHMTGQHELFKLLYKHKKPEIISRYRKLRESIISPSYVASHFYNYGKKIPLAAYNAENELWRDRPCSSVNNAAQIAQWYSERVKWIDAEIAEMEERFEQVATEGLAYTETGHSVYGKKIEITGIGTATDTDIVIPKWIDDAPVYKMAKQIFRDNTTITSATIPDSVEGLPHQAFYGATSLKNVILPDSLTTPTTSDTSQFMGSGVTELAIPKKWRTIPQYFATNCASLTSVTMGNMVTEIDAKAFSGCTALSSIRLSSGLKTVKNQCLYKISATKLVLPDKLETIADNALERLIKVEEMTIPASVKTIGVKGCSGWWVCKKVVFKGTPESIGENAFFELGGTLPSGTAVDIYVPWHEGAVAGAPWGSTRATIHYNSTI